jgi:hypothetical protein
LTLIKRCLILLALVWAQIPASVLAVARQSTPACNMTCCAVKVIQPKVQEEPACKKCPSENVANASDSSDRPETAISAHSGKDSCRCKIAPRSSPGEHSNTPCLTSSGVTDQTFDASLAHTRLRFDVAALMVASPGIVGTDSGPPTHRPSCVWLGRAPPVHVA